jgi:hypothetical protein
VRASTQAPVIESALASRRHPGPFCASPAPDLLAAWSFCLFSSLCRLGMNPNPSTPVTELVHDFSSLLSSPLL